MRSQKIIAMIPARMGSKRVPRKNIRLLFGKPLLQYAIEGAMASGSFDEIWVNSESQLIGDLAIECGANFHKRPVVLSSDMATNQEFTTEFLHVHKCDYVVMVNPTSPLLRPETIQRFCDFVMTGRFDTVVSVLEERAECFFNGMPVNFSKGRKINSQELSPVEKIVWALTAWRREQFLDVAGQGECGVFSGRLGRYSISESEACDIDTQEQWDLAEAMLFAREKKMSKAAEGQIHPKYWGPHEKYE